ncbi:hypothetical protein KAU33_03920 [Candidatus Dependentiae bacterium]|nr:hypothetical protein [Candidatus Dependentiae bacterium]
MQIPEPIKPVGIPATFPTIKSCFSHETFYPLQEKILDILQANYDNFEYFILEAPPGVGKTAIADAFIGFHKHGEVLTKQIRLQDQYINGYGFKKVQGRRHFNCLVEALPCSRGKCLSISEDEDVCRGCPNASTCEKTTEQIEECETNRAINNEISKKFSCHNKPYKPRADSEVEPDEDLLAGCSKKRGKLYWRKHDDNCEYWLQKMNALNSKKVAHNYFYYLYESNFVGDFGSPEVLVCDEAHSIEQILMEFVSVSISAKELERIGAPIPNFADVDSWITWLISLHQNFIPRRLKELEAYFEETTKPDNRKKIEMTRLEVLYDKVDYFLSKYHIKKGIWLFLPYQNYQREFEKVEFRPMYIDSFAQDKLFQNSKKKLLMSATILDFETFKRSLGISGKKCISIQVPSPFPVENRPIYKANIGRLDAKSINPANDGNMLDKLMSFIDTTLENPHFRNSKGLIHTTTYKMAEYIEDHSAYAPRMLFHTDSEGANKILEQHKNTNEPTVIVSPSMTDGVSFDDDLARFQIPLRVPYLNVGDPVIKARADSDRPWYFWMTGTTLFQSIGRIVRNMGDYGVTIIPDSRISYFLGKQFGYSNIPRWILDSLKTPEELEADYGLSYDFGE